MKCQSEDEFLLEFDILTAAWTHAMVAYYEKSIKSTILHSAGRWIIEP